MWKPGVLVRLCVSLCVYAFVCVCMYVCVWPEASLVSGSPEHAGTAGQCVSDLSIWSLPGAHTALLCSVCLCVCVCFSKANPSGCDCPWNTHKQAHLLSPSLSVSTYVTTVHVSQLSTVVKLHLSIMYSKQKVPRIPRLIFVRHLVPSSFLSLAQQHTLCASPLPQLSDADYRLCVVLSVHGKTVVAGVCSVCVHECVCVLECTCWGLCLCVLVGWHMDAGLAGHCYAHQVWNGLFN